MWYKIKGQFHSCAFFFTLYASFVTVHFFQNHLLERLSFPILFSCCLSCKLTDHTHIWVYFWALYSSLLIYVFFFFFNALQNFVVFCHTSARISHRYTHVPSLGSKLPSHLPLHPTLPDCHRAPAWVPWITQQIPIQFSSVIQSCLTLCNPMDCSIPGLPVRHQLLEFTQTYVHWVSDAIQPYHPLSSHSPPAFNLSKHHGLFKWVSSVHQVTRVLLAIYFTWYCKFPRYSLHTSQLVPPPLPLCL